MQQIESTFEFFIDKDLSKLIFKNNTSKQNIYVTLADPVQANSTTTPYDNTGAAKYIIIVILMYGFAIVFFIGSQVKSTRKRNDNVDSQNAEQVLQQMESTIFAKEVTNKLLDKEHRDRAWAIYLSNTPKKDGAEGRRGSNDLDNEANYKEMADRVESMERKVTASNISRSSRFSILRHNFRKSKLRRFFFKDDSNLKRGYSSPKTPTIRLQTDVEGLLQLKEKRKARQNREELGTSNSQSSIANKSPSRTIERERLIKGHAGQDLANESVISFDVCEISEQITTV